ncbi:hypothetical protein EF916_31490, partial [Streptomyces sp. WAC08452]
MAGGRGRCLPARGGGQGTVRRRGRCGEALALHKAEEEAAFKQAGAESEGVSQVIDLTAHDETEQIDVQ